MNVNDKARTSESVCLEFQRREFCFASDVAVNEHESWSLQSRE